MPWKFGAAIDIGKRREQQDRLCIMQSPDRRRLLVAIADGMGGMRNGAQAAQRLVDAAAAAFEQAECAAPLDFLKSICVDAHHAINELEEHGQAPGTTAALLYVDGYKAHWAHVGDSRIYHYRRGRLLTQTQDHSLLQIMVSRGMVDPDSSAAKSLQNQLYMRLGGERLPSPEYAGAAVEHGDLFVLCSDGFWQTMRPAQVLAALEIFPLGGECEKHLVGLARQQGGEQCDNISLAMLQWHEDGPVELFKRWFG